jgi:hypothetical protein
LQNPDKTRKWVIGYRITTSKPDYNNLGVEFFNNIAEVRKIIQITRTILRPVFGT